MDQVQFSQFMTRLTDLIDKVGARGQFSGKSGELQHAINDMQALGYTLQVTATNQSALLLPVNLKRRFLFMLNDDALGYARIAFGSAATLSLGMKLAAGGGGVFMDNNVPKAQINIIGSIAQNSNITLIEA